MPNAADPIVGVTQALQVFLGATTAALVAPHLVVVIAGMAGGVLGLMSWKRATLGEGMLYVFGMGALAWLLAGTAAELAALTWKAIDDKRMLTPAALCIGWVGHRWPTVGRWAARLMRAWIEAALKGGRP